MSSVKHGPKTGNGSDDGPNTGAEPTETKTFAEETNAIEPPEPWPEPGQVDPQDAQDE